MQPMLATPSPEDFAAAVVRKVNDPNFGCDIKCDGVRLLIDLSDGPTGFNRSGGLAEIPMLLTRELERAGSAPFAIDGELIRSAKAPGGFVWWAFDIMGEGVPAAWEDRRAALDGLVARWKPSPALIRVVPWATTTVGKAELAQRVVREGLEGLIAKRIGSTYIPGARSKSWLKLKQKHSVDCVVTGANIDSKANYQLSLRRENQWTVVGEVSALTGDSGKIRIGDVVAVEFLYLGANERLVQPVTPRLRRDKSPESCTWDQLPPIPGEMA